MNWLEFANPLGWWWAALALPIIAFYVLKVRLRRQRVSTFKFWDRVFEEKRPRAWWQQLRHWMSLLLQLALLLLLVGALVDPLWSWQKGERRKLIVVLDNSASMAAVDEEGTRRFDQAKQMAAALIRSLRAGDEMAILTAGGKPGVAIGLTDHARSLLEALEGVALTDAPTALLETVRTARRLSPNENDSRIFVLTDGCDPATGDLIDDKSITLYGFGKPLGNVAITQFQARRSLLDAIGYQVLIEVTNLGDQPQTCQLDLTLEDELIDVVPLEIEAGASKTLNLDQASNTGGRLVARLDCQDGLAADNVALAVLPVRRPMPVTLITPGSVFLQSVLESIPLVDLTIDESIAALDPNTHDVDGSRRVLVLHQRIPEKLPPGKLFIINPTSDCDLWNIGEAIEQPLVTNVKADSPVTQHVKLANVLFPEARQLNFNVDAETLIGTALDEPLLVHIHRPEGDALVLNLNLDQGDLPLRIAFPVLMKNAIEWFQGSRAELQPSISTGQSARVELASTGLINQPSATLIAEPHPASPAKDDDAKLTVMRDAAAGEKSNELWVRAPGGDLIPLAHNQQQATISLLTHCGLWTIGSREDLNGDPWFSTPAPGAVNSRSPSKSNTVRSKSNPSQAAEPSSYTIKKSSSSASGNDVSANTTADDSTHAQGQAGDGQLEDRLVRIASNLCNREESDLRPRVALERPESAGLLALGGWSIWIYLAAAALVMFAIEWWLYQRRVVG